MSPFTAHGPRNPQFQTRSIVVIVPAVAVVVVILIVLIFVIVFVPILLSLTVFAFFVSSTAGTLTYYHPRCGTGPGPNYRSILATHLAPDNRTGRTAYGASDGFV